MPSPFGAPLRGAYDFAPSYLPLNHGSYGATPTAVRAAQAAVGAQLDSRPDSFIRYELAPGLARSRAAAARLLNSAADDVVLAQNASTAVDTVIRSLCGVSSPEWAWADGDVALYYEGAYSAVEKALLHAAETRPGVKLERLEVAWPVGDDELVERFEAAIVRVNAGPTSVRLAVVDSVISMPGIRVPWERLCAVCRRHGVLSLVDAAHGLGHVPIDVAAAQPDFLTTNLHKWLSVPRGCAAFYVRRELQPLLRSTLPTSLNFVPRPTGDQRGSHHPLPPIHDATPFVDLWAWTATVDYTGYLAVEAALAWRRDVLGGEQAIMDYQNGLARKAGDVAVAVLGTEVMACAGSSTQNCAFANVRLPVSVGERAGDAVVKEEHAPRVIAFLQARGSRESGLYPQTILYRGNWWWRISAAPYVDEDDVRRGAEIVKGLCDRIRDGSWLGDDVN